jgi:hypothetical protein
MKKIKLKIPKQKQRVIWGFDPTTRVVKNKKAYNRKTIKARNKYD